MRLLIFKNKFTWFMISLHLFSFLSCSVTEETMSKNANKSSLNLLEQKIEPSFTYVCPIHHKNLKNSKISESEFNHGLNLLCFGSVILIVSFGILCKPDLVIAVVLCHVLIVLFCHWLFYS